MNLLKRLQTVTKQLGNNKNIKDLPYTEWITELKPYEIFVFGSNESGIHRAGAAKTAMGWGAVYGTPFGKSGNTFAIPTKSAYAKDTLPLSDINDYIYRFAHYARNHPEYTFLVTEIGCGLANLSIEQIAPMFSIVTDLKNVKLPKTFYDYLNN